MKKTGGKFPVEVHAHFNTRTAARHSEGSAGLFSSFATCMKSKVM